nr:MAG TPA: hypothetical protein [Caudoviricetes sp.]
MSLLFLNLLLIWFSDNHLTPIYTNILSLYISKQHLHLLDLCSFSLVLLHTELPLY